MFPTSLRAAFDKIPEGHRQYVAVILQRAMSITTPSYDEGTLPSLDLAFNLLGRATIRKDLLKEVEKKVSYGMGYNFIVVKIEGVHDLIECCEKEVALLNKMVQAILQKEIPHVKPHSESVDVPVEFKSE